MPVCPHTETEVAANTITGEVYAELCVACFAELPPGYNCPDCETYDVQAWGVAGTARRVFAAPCERHR